MRYDDLIRYFGTQDGIARALGIRQASVAKWPRPKVPPRWQYQLEIVTGGALKVDPPLRYFVPPVDHGASLPPMIQGVIVPPPPVLIDDDRVTA